MRKAIRKRAYWIFDEGFVAPTFLSVYSFLQWCDIPVVLLYYGRDLPLAEMWFHQLEKERDVLLVHVDDSFFSLPIFEYNNIYTGSINNRELRFYVASQSGPHDVTYCFDSDIIFSEKCRKLIDLEFDGKPSVFGCKERQHTYENVLFFERGKIHPAEKHIYPEFSKDIYDSIFKEDTKSWFGNPQLNNGVLIYSNVPELAKVWREKHEYGLILPIVNPGEDQVTLVAALSQLKHIEVKYLDFMCNSKGQLNGQFGVYHATGGQWKGEIINALSKEEWMEGALSDCARTYKRVIEQSGSANQLSRLFCKNNSPNLYYSIPGFFFFVSTYEYIFNHLPPNAIFVEIGTYKGKSICYMAEKVRLAKKNVTLYSIDDYSNVGFPDKIAYVMAEKNLKERGLASYVNLINQKSDASAKLFADLSLDAIFIDGDLRYEGVWQDLNCWYGKVKRGGIIAGNNYTRIESVRKAVDDFGKMKNIKWLLQEQCYIYIKQ